MPDSLTIAAIVPCHDEEVAIGTVVDDLRAAVPGIDVYVYDNCSTDRTAEVAAAHGAIVRTEHAKGKGNVVRRAFADIDADVYLMIDGDDTYDASAAPEMIQTLLEGPYDHVLGCRTDDPQASAHRPGHARGNAAFNMVVGRLFGTPVTDMFSGYRVFSRRFVKSFPALSREFEIETELTIHSMALRVPQREVPVGFKERPEGSASKLRTVRDGLRICWAIARMFVHERPFAAYGGVAALLLVASLVLGLPVVYEFTQTGLVERFPTAILASSLAILGMLAGSVGLLLTGVLRLRRESMRLAYLRLPAVSAPAEEPLPIR
ncbi:glycosyltransferase [Sanguibacter massiliensis]|uniref:glycosyltransferase n=1 Tax=Sanguibacter massiliensis TaxID=1973217 RepID=UPI000C85AED1|nr:glycosyltransferase [Sanguibacter massiliensis]